MTALVPSQNKRVAIVAPTLAGVLRDRCNLIRALKARGHAVLAVAQSHMSGEVAALHHLGGEHRSFDPKPPGMALFANRRVVHTVRDLLAAWQADVAIVCGEQLASLAAVAARKAGVRTIIAVAAADLSYGSDAERSRLAPAFRRAVKLSQAVVCHNGDDALAISAALKPKGKALIVTAGDGVDLDAYAAVPLPRCDQALTFLMIANPDAREAIGGYAEAARALAAKGVSVRCVLATDREAAQDTTLFTVQGVEFYGRAADPAALLSTAHVAVHLSAEDGSPAAVKQALAVGRPVLTLDVPGCREAIDERVNGCVIPAGDQIALVAAMESFVTLRGLLASEARAARAKAEQSFGASAILAPVVQAIEA